jgi:hypothetical protein
MEETVYIHNIVWICVACDHTWFAQYTMSDTEFEKLIIICPACGSDNVDL